MTRYFTISLFLIISNFCFAQNTYYQSAKVIKNNNEVLIGYVEKTSESSLNPEIKFKEDLESETITTIVSADIQELVFINDSSVFNRVVYTHKVKDEEISEYRLAKLMMLGHADMFKLQLPDKEQNIIFEKK